MLNQDHLVRLLNQPGAQSGTHLGEVLGVSRVAIQKRIKQLTDNGLPIAAVSGKGYTLEDGVRLLEKEELSSFVKHTGLLESIEILQCVESTNSHLLAQTVSKGGAKVCVAESQTAGRGRRGNDWQSAPYRNIMLSMSWGFSNWPETITGLGLAVALVVVEHINSAYGLDVRIKWPNDLMVGEDKLGGILIDVAGESSGVCNVVIGLGLNIHQPDWAGDESAYRWKDFETLGVIVNRNELIANIAVAWSLMLQEFDESGFTPLAERWNALSSYAGRKVRVGNAEQFVEGQMQGVDSVGALLVQSADGEIHRFSDSGVSVRLV